VPLFPHFFPSNNCAIFIQYVSLYSVAFKKVTIKIIKRRKLAWLSFPRFLFCEGKEGRKKNPLETMKNPFLFCFTQNFFFVHEEYEDLPTRSEEKLTQVPKFSYSNQKNKFMRNFSVPKVKTKVTTAYRLNLFHFQSLRHTLNQSLRLKQKKSCQTWSWLNTRWGCPVG